MLRDVLPAPWRKGFYVAYGAVGVVLGSIQVWVSSTGQEQPPWIIGALAVYAYVGGAFGGTASSNVNKSPGEEPRHVGSAQDSGPAR